MAYGYGSWSARWLWWRGGRSLRRDRRTVGELLRAGHDDAVAWFQALEDRVVVADDRPDLDRPLLRGELAAGVLGHEGEELAVDAQHRGDRHDQAVGGVPDDPRPDVL